MSVWRGIGVGGGCQHGGMGARTGSGLRRIGDPVVAAGPAGVRICTRVHVTDAEAAALRAIGEFLGSVYRSELAERIGLGVLDHDGQAAWRAERKRVITAVASSRWAGAITRAVEDQYQLGMRALAAHVVDLRARLAAAQAALAAGRPSVVVGGQRLWRHRQHLDAAELSERQWRRCWDAARMFVTADGETGKPGGNETIRVDDPGRLRIKVPAALADTLGTHLVIGAPVQFSHRGDEWAARVAARRAVRYDICYDPARGRWYAHASWKTSPEPPPPLAELRAGRVLGTDLNADHLACCVLDCCGNPVGEPTSIAIETTGMRASRRDGRVRAAISTLLDTAHQAGCSAIVVENLNFVDARATGRETLGRGKRGKRLRRTVAGIPTAKFRTRLTAMATRRQIAVIGVDAAYTSRWGAQHWHTPLQQQTSDPATVTGHHGAAVAIGRRGLGVAIRRRPAGPRNGQRTAAGTPPTRPEHQPNATPRRCRSPGSPTHPHRGVPVHRPTPTASGQHRSGRTGLTPDQ